jgi:hypothetical protein
VAATPKRRRQLYIVARSDAEDRSDRRRGGGREELIRPRHPAAQSRDRARDPLPLPAPDPVPHSGAVTSRRRPVMTPLRHHHSCPALPFRRSYSDRGTRLDRGWSFGLLPSIQGADADDAVARQTPCSLMPFWHRTQTFCIYFAISQRSRYLQSTGRVRRSVQSRRTT